MRLHLPLLNIPARSRASESRQALSLQNRLIPQTPAAPDGLDCIAHCLRDECDGSFFDLFRPRRNELAAVVGNISSGGLAGSILVTGVHSALRCMVRQGVGVPDSIGEINRILWELTPVAVDGSLFSARVDPIAGCLRYINAGHTAAALVRDGGETDLLDSNAPPLALTREGRFVECRVPFLPGDALVITSNDVDPRDVLTVVGDPYGRLRDWPSRIAEAGRSYGCRIVVIIRYREAAEFGAASLRAAASGAAA